MKPLTRLSVALALTLAIPSLASAQVHLGGRGGLVSASTTFEEFSSEFRSSAVVGGFAAFGRSRLLSVQVELLLMTKGFSTVGYRVDGTTARFRYLEAPVLLRLALPEPGRFRPAVMAGGYYGYEIGCDVSGQQPLIDGTDSCNARFRLRGKGDVGVVFAASIDYAVSERAFILLDGRYNHGLRNLHFDPDSERTRTRSWAVTGGFGIEVGG